jgi:hypothetical protein
VQARPEAEAVLYFGSKDDVAGTALRKQFRPRFRIPARDHLVSESLNERVVRLLPVVLTVVASRRTPWHGHRVWYISANGSRRQAFVQLGSSGRSSSRIRGANAGIAATDQWMKIPSLTSSKQAGISRANRSIIRPRHLKPLARYGIDSHICVPHVCPPGAPQLYLSRYFSTASSRTLTPRPGAGRSFRTPSSCTHGSLTRSCCRGDSCGLRSSVSPFFEIAKK